MGSPLFLPFPRLCFNALTVLLHFPISPPARPSPLCPSLWQARVIRSKMVEHSVKYIAGTPTRLILFNIRSFCKPLPAWASSSTSEGNESIDTDPRAKQQSPPERIDLENGYLLLRAKQRTAAVVTDAEANAISTYLQNLRFSARDPASLKVTCWARLRQHARSLEGTAPTAT